MLLEILTQASEFVATFMPFMVATHDSSLSVVPMAEVQEYADSRAIDAAVRMRERHGR